MPRHSSKRTSETLALFSAAQIDGNFMAISGVYSITHAESGTVYIGSAENIRKRWRRHRSDLRKGKHRNPHLQNAWAKHGEAAFVFAIQETCPVEQTEAAEQRHLDEAVVRLGKEGVYNIALDTTAFNRGRRHTPETRAKMSAAKIGRKLTEEHRAKLSAARRGRKRKPFTAEHRAKISAAGRGRECAAETRAKMSAASLGKKKTDEVRANMRAAWRARKLVAKEANGSISALALAP